MGNCDIVGFDFAPHTRMLTAAVAVELKLDDIGGVISKALSHVGMATELWVAMPAARIHKFKPVTFTRLQELGIGLLSVGVVGCAVTVHGPIRVPEQRWQRMKHTAWRRRNEHKQRMQNEHMLSPAVMARKIWLKEEWERHNAAAYRMEVANHGG